MALLISSLYAGTGCSSAIADPHMEQQAMIDPLAMSAGMIPLFDLIAVFLGLNLLLLLHGLLFWASGWRLRQRCST
jgi:hypothetical protein